ncbi:MAG: hypothetical protein OQK45_08925 [Sulfurovum sp.]|nr:hypothetical protein [Sulfurovum sp.]
MNQFEPTLENIEDYNGKGSNEKRLTIWIVILSGLLLGAIYGIIGANASVSDTLVTKEQTGILKY